MSDEDRTKRDAEEAIKEQKAELMKKEIRLNITGERIPRIISLASFFPNPIGEEDGDSTLN